MSQAFTLVPVHEAVLASFGWVVKQKASSVHAPATPGYGVLQVAIPVVEVGHEAVQ